MKLKPKPKLPIKLTVRLCEKEWTKLDHLVKRATDERDWPMTKSDIVRELIAKA